MVKVVLAMAGLVCVGVATAAERTRLACEWRFKRGDPVSLDAALNVTNVLPWLDGMGRELIKNPQPFVPPAQGPGAGLSYAQREFNDAAWRPVRVPHDWGVDAPFSYDKPFFDAYLSPNGVGWYRRELAIPADGAGNRFYLDFDGAMSYAMVWINGHFVGGWPYGYTPFRVDLTPYAKPGQKNVLAVRIENPADSSRWYTGAGLYRNVWLVRSAPLHIGYHGVCVTTPSVSAEQAEVAVRVTVQNQAGSAVSAKRVSRIYEWANGKRGVRVAECEQEVRILPTGTATVEFRLTVKQPKLWELASPNLYVVENRFAAADGSVTDAEETTFGIRTIGFYPDERGFQLNGRHVHIKGACLHHDLGVLGAAFNARAAERRLALLREAGVNAIRMSHNQPAPELLDLCDRMGFLVKDEIFDQWNVAKHPCDYSVLFKNWHERDMRAWIRSDRNHPCVILWGLGNEIQDSYKQMPLYIETGRRLNQIAHEEDSTRPTTAANNNVESGFSGFEKVMDVFGCNYQGLSYERFHSEHPGIPLFGSETVCTLSSRGEYFFPVTRMWKEGVVDFYHSSYDWMACDYRDGKRSWACPPDDEWRDQEKTPSVMGDFIWTGFDYLGGPYYVDEVRKHPKFSDPSRQSQAQKEVAEKGLCAGGMHSCATGLFDLAGFPKDRFYLYQAQWRPDFAMAHILPHWNWPERVGQVTPVYVYTSGDEAELFLNGKSLGRRAKEKDIYRLMWNEVVYAPGELHAVAYKAGKRWAEDRVSTTGPAVALALMPERARIESDGEDIAFVALRLTDADGRTVPRSRNRVRLMLRGPGEIVATDNGDETDFDSFKSQDRRVFNGLLSVLVRGTAGASGKLTLRAESDGLSAAETAVLLEKSDAK